jgi:hypothetical protein
LNGDCDYEARRNLEPATGLGWEALQYAAGGSVCIRVLEGTVTVWISPGAGLGGSSGGRIAVFVKDDNVAMHCVATCTLGQNPLLTKTRGTAKDKGDVIPGEWVFPQSKIVEMNDKPFSSLVTEWMTL